MRRDLTIRCVSTGTVRTDGPDGVRCELRDIGLELDGAPAHVRIIETRDRGQCTRETLAEFDRIAVRQRAHCAPANAPARVPLDWLVAVAATMEQGESRTVSLWVRTMEPAALLHATPVSAIRCTRPANDADEAEDAAIGAASRLPYLRLVAAGP
jgi:hypothetical protein